MIPPLRVVSPPLPNMVTDVPEETAPASTAPVPIMLREGQESIPLHLMLPLFKSKGDRVVTDVAAVILAVDVPFRIRLLVLIAAPAESPPDELRMREVGALTAPPAVTLPEFVTRIEVKVEILALAARLPAPLTVIVPCAVIFPAVVVRPFDPARVIVVAEVTEPTLTAPSCM